MRSQGVKRTDEPAAHFNSTFLKLYSFRRFSQKQGAFVSTSSKISGKLIDALQWADLSKRSSA